MSRPLALDLFCCAGGSATGLERAGFDVIGIDHKPSQHWCGTGELHRADLSTAESVEAVIRAFRPDFVSASPPCQAFSSVTPETHRANHRDLIDSTRKGITATGVPGWLENVHGAPLHHAIRLCGSMFPETQRVQRHRYFELIGWFVLEPDHAACSSLTDRVTVAGRGANGGNPAKCSHEDYMRRRERNRPGRRGENWLEALGWPDGPRDLYGLSQAIPPAYAEWLGRAFLARLP